MKTLIIGLSGKAEHGKSAASRIIMEACEFLGITGRIFEISSMLVASAISRGLLPPGTLRCNCSREQIKILVDEGAWGRAIDQHYWTKQVKAAIAASGVSVAVVPNIRFHQESGESDYVIRINRLNEDRTPFISTTRDPNDVTETALDYWPADFYITNISGHGKLLEMNVTTLFHYIWEDLWLPKN